MRKEIDLHGMDYIEAKVFLKQYFDGLPKGNIEVLIVHGYRNGSRLQVLVRKEFKHVRIVRKFVELNPGHTTIWVK